MAIAKNYVYRVKNIVFFIYYTSGTDKLCLSQKNYVFQSKNTVYRSINSVYQIEKQSRLSTDKLSLSKNGVFRLTNRVYQRQSCLENLCFSIKKHCLSIEKHRFSINSVYGRPEKPCFSIWKTMFFKNFAFHSINIFFCNKLCFMCFSVINRVFRFIIHLACAKNLVYRVKCRVSEKHSFSSR